MNPPAGRGGAQKETPEVLRVLRGLLVRLKRDWTGKNIGPLMASWAVEARMLSFFSPEAPAQPLQSFWASVAHRSQHAHPDGSQVLAFRAIRRDGVVRRCAGFPQDLQRAGLVLGTPLGVRLAGRSGLAGGCPEQFEKLGFVQQATARAAQQESSGRTNCIASRLRSKCLRRPSSNSSRERISLGGSSATTSYWRPLRIMSRM